MLHCFSLHARLALPVRSNAMEQWHLQCCFCVCDGCCFPEKKHCNTVEVVFTSNLSMLTIFHDIIIHICTQYCHYSQKMNIISLVCFLFTLFTAGRLRNQEGKDFEGKCFNCKPKTICWKHSKKQNRRRN